jgi:hypothetical protein
MRKKPFVYIAHPIGRDPLGNARLAFQFADSLGSSIVPILPDNPAWHLAFPKSYEEWMARDFDLVAGCDALFRMPGESPGADREVAFAESNGILVFEDKDRLLAWAASWRNYTDK